MNALFYFSGQARERGKSFKSHMISRASRDQRISTLRNSEKRVPHPCRTSKRPYIHTKSIILSNTRCAMLTWPCTDATLGNLELEWAPPRTIPDLNLFFARRRPSESLLFHLKTIEMTWTRGVAILHIKHQNSQTRMAILPPLPFFFSFFSFMSCSNQVSMSLSSPFSWLCLFASLLCFLFFCLLLAIHAAFVNPTKRPLHLRLPFLSLHTRTTIPTVFSPLLPSFLLSFLPFVPPSLVAPLILNDFLYPPNAPTPLTFLSLSLLPLLPYYLSTPTIVIDIIFLL